MQGHSAIVFYCSAYRNRQLSCVLSQPVKCLVLPDTCTHGKHVLWSSAKVMRATWSTVK